MRIGIIAPTNTQRTSMTAGRLPATCERAVRQAGQGLAASGHDLVVVPAPGVGLLAAEAYDAAGDRRLIGISPDGGTSGQTAKSCGDEHPHFRDKTINDLDWTDQHE